MSSAAEAVTTLKVEPGVYADWSARFTSGPAGSLSSDCQRSSMLAGSKVGPLASARIAPVFGSSATTAPGVEPSASTAACWMRASTVRTRSVPTVGRWSSDEISRSTGSAERTPRRYSSTRSSRPLLPNRSEW